MIVKNLTEKSEIYTSNAYLCSDNKNNGCRLLIDTGCDHAIIPLLRHIGDENGLPPIREVILTHSHYDHTRMIKEIKAVWPEVKTSAFSAYVDGVDQVLTGGEKNSVCTMSYEIIHLPGHSTDSIGVFFPREGILFSGDSPIVIWGTEATYELPFLTAFEELARLPVTTIYPGHGAPIIQDCTQILEKSLRNLKQSRII